MNPRSAREQLNYGLGLLRVGLTDAGIAALEKARQLDPSLPHTYFNLGIELKRRGETDRAIAEFEQMAKLVPEEAKTHYNLGVLYKQKGRPEQAGAAATVVTATVDRPYGYGRIIRTGGRVVRIVEERDASPAERTFLIARSSFPISPANGEPNATTIAPVKVATSTTMAGLNVFA